MIRKRNSVGSGKRAKKRRRCETTADSLITPVKRRSANSDKIPEEQKHRVRKLYKREDAVKTGGLADISAKVEELRRLVQEGRPQAVYQQAAAQRAPQQQAARNLHSLMKVSKGRKTVEAEYKVVDEEKK